MTELDVILTTGGVVVALTYLWSSSALPRLRRPLGRVARCLNRHWMTLFLASILMFALFLLLADNYGDAQQAVDAPVFAELVPTADHGIYVATALFDVAFAAVYGAFALSVLPTFRRWGGDYRRLGSIGGGLLVVAACFDEVENVLLLLLLGRLPLPPGVTHESEENIVSAMTAVGSAKMSCFVVGGALIIVVRLARWVGEWRRRLRPATRVATEAGGAIGAWLRLSWVPYAAYVCLVVAFVIVAALRQRWAFVVLVPSLLFCGSWLNEAVWRSRQRGGGSPGVDLGPVRFSLSVLQLVAGGLLVGVGFAVGGAAGGIALVGDFAMVLGIALVLMSLGSLVSELRQNRRLAGGRAVVGFGLAGAVLVAARNADTAGWMFGLVVVGVLLGEVATEIGTEDYVRHPPPSHLRWAVAAVGAVGAAAAVWWLIAGDGDTGVDPWHAFGLVVVLAAVVLMASVDGDALVVVLLLAVVLVATTRPGNLEVDDELVAVPGEPYILVLGDSYTSGEGAVDYLPGTNTRAGNADHTNECRRAPAAWAFQLAELVTAAEIGGDGSGEPVPTRVLFLACSGAETENIRPVATEEPVELADDYNELALYQRERARLGGPPSFVIVGIGGNDAGFGDLGTTCFGPGNCAAVADQFLNTRRAFDRATADVDERDDDGDGFIDEPDDGWPEALANIGDDLAGTYAAIREEVDDGVPIVTTTYPVPIALDTARCAGTLLETEERAFINAFANQLNETVTTVAREARVHVMDLSGSLARKGLQLCATGPGSAGLNFIAFGSKGGTVRDSLNPEHWSHNSFHPTKIGHRELAEDAYKWLSRSWPLAESPPTTIKSTDVDSDDGPSAVDFGVPPCDPADQPCSVEDMAWTEGEAMDLFVAAVAPLALLMFSLWAALVPFVVIGRSVNADGDRRFTLYTRWKNI